LLRRLYGSFCKRGLADSVGPPEFRKKGGEQKRELLERKIKTKKDWKGS